MSDSYPQMEYAALRSTLFPGVREGMSSYRGFPYTERHLQCVWYDPQYRPNPLRTADGEDVRVAHPGHWNLEAGPDFRDARLIIGPEKRQIRGDVEIHIHPRDWTAHQHRSDPRYARVAAHITYFPGRLASDSLPPGTIQLALKSALAAVPRFSFDVIDITAYPYAARPPIHLPCADSLAKSPPDRAIALLESAGTERIHQKAQRIAADMQDYGPDQMFYENLLYALGYKHNRMAFQQLARQFTLERLRETAGMDPIRVYALLLGVSGLMPRRPAPRWDRETSAFVRKLWDIWWKEEASLAPLTLPADTWHLSSLRPQNHPVRRLAAAAALFCRKPSILDALQKLDPGVPKDWFTSALALLTSATLPYWDHRLSFSGAKRPQPSALIGKSRASAILANVFVPFLKATGTDVAPLLPHLPPEQVNALIRQTAHALFGRDHNPTLYRTGLRRQGLLQIFHDFCLNDREGCQKCRLAAALRD